MTSFLFRSVHAVQIAIVYAVAFLLVILGKLGTGWSAMIAMLEKGFRAIKQQRLREITSPILGTSVGLLDEEMWLNEAVVSQQVLIGKLVINDIGALPRTISIFRYTTSGLVS
jgi:hypothetical protein